MKKLVYLLVYLAVFPILLSCQPKKLLGEAPFHTPPLEQTQAETGQMAKEIKNSGIRIDPLLAPVIETGKRNLDWQKHINKFRGPGHEISFTDGNSNAGGIPIDSPRTYNPEIIRTDYDKQIAALPIEMKNVLINNQVFTDDIPVDLESYRKWGRALDRAYQIAIRWESYQPFMSYLIAARRHDIRGYWDLTKFQDLLLKLKDFSKLPTDEQTRLRQDLKGICINVALFSDPYLGCENEIQSQIQKNDLIAFYDRYFLQAKEHFDSYFKITTQRPDVLWSTQDPLHFKDMRVPFLNPGRKDFYDFLKINLEDEWHWTGFQLVMDFQDSSPDEIPHLEFVPGALPHVNGIAGNTITMDANTSLAEYEVNWTIRHEYGHVLGFPDCYLEFFDQEKKAIVSYQIDITNIMCSRAGHVKELHATELIHAYRK